MSRNSKYGNKKVEIESITFDSKAEGWYYQLLKILKQQGKVSHFLLQVPFNLPGGIKYRLDFLVFYTDGHQEYIDVKGAITQVFKMKKKQVEALYPVTIRCVRHVSQYRFKDVQI